MNTITTICVLMLACSVGAFIGFAVGYSVGHEEGVEDAGRRHD